MATRCEDPGSGLWIFENETIKAWIDPDSPLIPYVWLLGIPGAGKSVSPYFQPNL